MKPTSFEYHAPTSLDDAVGLLADLGDEAKVLAGGQSLVPMLSLRLASFANLVDIGRIPELRGVRHDADAVVVGAATVDAHMERDREVATRVPLLAQVTPLIGHFQIRNRGTVGGSIAHADPAAEYPAVAVALDATIEAVSTRGRRDIPAADFFQGFWSTALDPDEVLAGTRFPVWSGRTGFAVREFARRHGDFAIAGAVIGVEVDADDRIARCAIGLLGLGPTPLRARDAERAAVEQGPAVDAGELGNLAMADLDDVPADLHGSAAYRRRVGAAMGDEGVVSGARGGDRLGDVRIRVNVNGDAREAEVEARRTLADFLREDCRLTGTHLGCEHGVCGACTVLLDGEAVRSCLLFAVQADGAEVTTIEGMGDETGGLSPVQQAFRDGHGLQCGFCTPGFVVSVSAFLRDNPRPSEREIREALSGNLCRCTGYQGIIEAVRLAAASVRP